MRIGSAVILAVLVIGILVDQREQVSGYFADVGLAAGLFCAISLVLGYVIPKAAGVSADQAIASSMEIGVHNATLAIFVAVEVLDETAISVPAAVYSLFMFVFATVWGSFVSRRSRAADRHDLSRSTTVGVIARNAFPRWEIRSFSSGASSAEVRLPSCSSGHEQHVVAEAAAAAQLPDDATAHDALGEALRTAGVAQRHGATELCRRAARRVRRPAGRAGAGCSARRSSAGPTSAPRGPRACWLSASTQRPLSSASDGSPVASTPARAFSRALPSKVGWSSTGSSYGVTSSRPENLDAGQVLAEDPPHLLDLPGVAGGQEDALSHRARASVCIRVRSAQPFSARDEHGVELRAVEGRALGGALHLDEAAVAGHHDVHVGLGADVLLVGQVQPRKRRR